MQVNAIKVMLAGKFDPTKAVFPLLASPKLDGVRAVVLGSRLMSRNMKPIPNAWVQEIFSTLPEGTDGELILGNPTHPEAYRNTVSAVMSEDGKPTDVRFWIFDNYKVPGGFETRFATLKDSTYVHVVPHVLVTSLDELTKFEEAAIERGFEGAMVRRPGGHYKHGRSTTGDGLLLKVKRFEDAEARVVSVYAWQKNGNEAKTNVLGHTERSSHQENKTDLPILGGLNVVGLEEPYVGVEFSIGTGFSGADDVNGERGKLWCERDRLVGRLVKFKYFPTGSKDRPRFPVFLGWRDERDR